MKTFAELKNSYPSSPYIIPVTTGTRIRLSELHIADKNCYGKFNSKRHNFHN